MCMYYFILCLFCLYLCVCAFYLIIVSHFEIKVFFHLKELPENVKFSYNSPLIYVVKKLGWLT